VRTKEGTERRKKEFQKFLTVLKISKLAEKDSKMPALEVKAPASAVTAS
jgi:hypothetical protein